MSIHTDSHPESREARVSTADLDEAQQAITENRANKLALRKPEQIARADYRDRINAYRAKEGLTYAQLGKKLETGVTQITKYLNDKADFSVAPLERKIAEFLRNAGEREKYRQTIFETSVTRAVEAVIEEMRGAEQLGLLHGEAGWGKTSGKLLYLAKNSLAVDINVFEWCRGAHEQARLLWQASGSGVVKYGQRRIEWLVEHFRGSERPILVDNAHLLTLGGLRFWFGFRDATGVPIVFIGNPEVVQSIGRSDQMFSRLGPHHITGLKDGEFPDVAAALIGQALKQDAPELLDLAIDTIAQKGHLRALWNQLTTARELKKRKDGDWRTAFRAAGNLMVREQTFQFAPVAKRKR